LYYLSIVSIICLFGPWHGWRSFCCIIGFFAAVLLGLWAVLYYPIKRALKNKKDKKMMPKESENEFK